MAFNPSSTIRLCTVPFDSSQKNQVYFENLSAQVAYFTARVKKIFSDYLTVRGTSPDGKPFSSVKVADHIDNLRGLGINYMMYQNAQFGKHYFAFITEMVYINENTTQIFFEQDVYQTYLFDVVLQPSYVVREHSATDEIGDNVVPEQFNVGEYEYTRLGSPIDNDKVAWGYLLCATETVYEVAPEYCKSGIFQGLYFHYFDTEANLAGYLGMLTNEGDCVVSITVIPKFCISASGMEETGYVLGSSAPAVTSYTVDRSAWAFTFGGYVPTNNKLFTSPFMNLTVSNHAGDEAVYNFEDFADPNDCLFYVLGDVSPNPSLTMYPYNYQGVSENIDAGISISGFPQCSYNTDTYKLWLAKNQYSIGMQYATGFGQMIAGGLMAGTGWGAVAGGPLMLSGASQVLNTICTNYEASKEPNRAHLGNVKSNLLTAAGFNKFDVYCRRIKRSLAQTIDAYFHMYGYQTNQCKTPNVSSRPYFNYVQTIDVNITGEIPNEDMQRLKQIYNEGVTLWKPTATMYNYNVDNSPEVG